MPATPIPGPATPTTPPPSAADYSINPFTGQKRNTDQIAAIQQGIAAVNQQFAGFTPDFYANRAKQYQTYALPQLAQQYQVTRNQSVYDLANRGLSQSGAAQYRANALSRELNTQKQNIVDTGTQQAQDLQRQVETQRNNIIQQFELTGDPASARQAALNTASGFQQPSIFSPLANLFTNWSNLYMANQAQAPINPSLYYMNPLVSPNLNVGRNYNAPLPSNYNVGGP